MKVRFLNNLIVKDTEDGFKWVIDSNFVFEVQWNGCKEEFVVPVGFETDFASVPRIFYRVVPPIGRYNRAAVMHDWFYATHKLSRSKADKAFLAAMEGLGVGMLTRKLMYRMVRWFGRKAYNAKGS